jgi:hypothetical protein
MGFGLNYDSNGGGDFLPICQYDAKAGRVFRRDKEQGQDAVKVDITRTFKAVIDLANVEIGWIDFPAGSAPDFVMAHINDPMPQKPANGGHKQGIRVMLKLAKECGGDVREMASSAKAFMRGLDELHTAFQAGEKENPGKLPVVVMKDTTPITSGEGAKKSTNYVPVFEITGWAARPTDLVYTPRSKTKDVSKPAAGTPPSTGSTRVDPPSATARTPEPVGEGVDDFG